MTSVYLTLCLFVLFIIIFFIILPRQNKKRSQRLLDYYNGKITYPLSLLIIPYENHYFQISRIGQGGGLNNTPSGSYPLIWAYVKKAPKILLGHENSKKYSYKSFFFLPKMQKILKCQEQNLLFATESSQIFSKNLNIENVLLLFQKDFQHLTICSEIHIQNFLPKKKYLLKYTGLPEEIYQSPELLKSYLEKITSLLAQLEIKLYSPKE